MKNYYTIKEQQNYNQLSCSTYKPDSTEKILGI